MNRAAVSAVCQRIARALQARGDAGAEAREFSGVS
jgi:hypothetical protein